MVLNISLYLARHYLKQIVDGMIYLHSFGILHRDLTLSNLLLTKEMNVVCVKFNNIYIVFKCIYFLLRFKSYGMNRINSFSLTRRYNN